MGRRNGVWRLHLRRLIDGFLGRFCYRWPFRFFFQECVSEQISFEELMDGFHVRWMSENLSRESQRTPPPLVFGQSTFTGFYQLLLDATRFYRV